MASKIKKDDTKIEMYEGSVTGTLNSIKGRVAYFSESPGWHEKGAEVAKDEGWYQSLGLIVKLSDPSTRNLIGSMIKIVKYNIKGLTDSSREGLLEWLANPSFRELGYQDQCKLPFVVKPTHQLPDGYAILKIGSLKESKKAIEANNFVKTTSKLMKMYLNGNASEKLEEFDGEKSSDGVKINMKRGALIRISLIKAEAYDGFGEGITLKGHTINCLSTDLPTMDENYASYASGDKIGFACLREEDSIPKETEDIDDVPF